MNWQGKRVLVTGAGGFIGSHLTERLAEAGARVRALVHYNALGTRGWLDHSPRRPEMEIIAGDICDRDSVKQAAQGAEIIFHLAALIAIPYSYRAPLSYVRTNVEGTLNVLQAAREQETERVVHTSTSEVYGTARYVPIDEAHPLQGQSPYSASKIGADKIAESFHLAFGVPVVTVRPFNTFGPRQSARAVIPTIIAQCLTGDQIRLGNLHPTRDLNFVSNTVDGFLCAGAEAAAVGRTINLGSGREISIGDLARLIAHQMDRPLRIESEEKRLRPQKSEVERLLASNALATELLHWHPKVSLEEGLSRTIEWVKSNLDKYRSDEYKSFEPGAPAPEGFIPLSVPEIRGNEWRYIKECLDTGWVSSVGGYVDRFEKEVARYVGTRHAVAAVNGTSALHVALRVAGVKPGDEVLVSTLTFIAPANAIRYAGAWPVFIDAEPDYWQMDPERVAVFLEKECQWEHGELRNRATGRRVKAILPVHILGHPVKMEPILGLARKFNLVVIEDATESLGAKYEGRLTGSLADMACLSFNGNKIITTGGGGMMTTDNEAWARKARYLTTQAKDDPLEYVHHEIGYNYRLTNVQGAMGCAQLEQLDAYVARKRSIAERYTEAFRTVRGITPLREARWAFSNYWLFTIRIDPAQFGRDSRQVLKLLAGRKIQARPLWQPMHLSPAHADCQRQACPTAERLHADCLSLPSSVGLKDEDLKRVCEVVVSAAKS